MVDKKKTMHNYPNGLEISMKIGNYPEHHKLPKNLEKISKTSIIIEHIEILIQILSKGGCRPGSFM